MVKRNKINILLYFIIFILVIIILLSSYALFMSHENIQIQKYLPDIYNKISKYTFSSMINPNYTLTRDNDIIILNNFLNKKYYQELRMIFNDKNYESREINTLSVDHNNLSIFHKKSLAIDFFNLHSEVEYNKLLEIYYSKYLIDVLSKILKIPIQRVNLSDPHACSLLIYDNEGDNIGWHYDNTNYYGDRYVVLLTIINENENKTGLSHNIFQYKNKNKIHSLQMEENSLIIFKGSEILHQSTSIEKNEKRILLSMTFCDICQGKKNIDYWYEKLKIHYFYDNTSKI
jgi:hypothetical protein